MSKDVIDFPAGYELIQTWDMVGKNHWFEHIVNKNSRD